MGALLPIAPIVAGLIARDWRYAAAYPRTVQRAANHLRGLVRSAAATRMRAHAMGAARRPERLVGTCTHCGNCSLDRSCVFLDWRPTGESRCRIHGSAFWNRLPCGRYPQNRFDIALYACPSFRAGPVAGAATAPLAWQASDSAALAGSRHRRPARLGGQVVAADDGMP